MRERHRKAGRSLIASLATLVVVFQGLYVLGAGQASAAPTCSVASGTLTLTDDGAGLDFIDMWQDTAGKVFVTVGPIPGFTPPNGLCGAGIDLTTLNTVNVVGGTGSSSVVIWMSQSFAASPATAPILSEGPGADWGAINWNIDLSHNADLETDAGLFSMSTVAVLSQSASDAVNVTVGTAGVDLQSDGNKDVAAIGVDSYALQGPDSGDDILSAAGGGVTGGPASVSVSLYGQAGDDSLTGGDGNDLFYPGPGNDIVSGGVGDDWVFESDGVNEIAGGPGDDYIFGGTGRDTTDGGAGNDLVTGSRGNDHLYGGPGGDYLAGGRGDDTLEGDGGHDRCKGGEGDDVVHCEVVQGRRR